MLLQVADEAWKTPGGLQVGGVAVSLDSEAFRVDASRKRRRGFTGRGRVTGCRPDVCVVDPPREESCSSSGAGC